MSVHVIPAFVTFDALDDPSQALAFDLMHDFSTPLPAAIEVEHLVKTYRLTRAVDDISFQVARRSVTALLGGNGAGKTTTIGMIMGLVRPTSGTVRVLGHKMPDESARTRLPRRCCNSSYEVKSWPRK